MAAFPIFASRRIRKTPYSARVEASGLSAYTTYNHMLLPAAFTSLAEDCAHLKQHVQIWDVAAERQVELKGKDAHKLACLMSARDLRNAVPGRGYYAPLCDAKGGMINDPIALCLAPDHFWFSIADSDVELWALGLATALNLDVEICEPDVSPLAIQGPKAEDLMAKVFGEEVRNIRMFRFQTFEFQGTPMIIQRSGWSKQGGFEIYLPRFDLGLALWDRIWEEGNTPEFQIRAGGPNLIERIEGGLLSYGNDMNRSNTPLECRLDRFLALDTEGANFMGRDALLRQRDEGLKQALVGVKIAGAPIAPLAFPFQATLNEQPAGLVTSAVHSPGMGSNIGFAMLAIDACETGTSISVETPEGWRQAEVCALPFPKA